MRTKSERLLNLTTFKKETDEILSKKKSYSIEVTLTEGCNWNCEYCFEGNIKKTSKKDLVTETPQVLLTSINSILNSEWFAKNFSNLNIDFWGGEPTLNVDLLKIVTDHYKDDERVSFFLYTNGSRIKEILSILDDLKDKKSINRKILVQISYDGNPIHDLRRIDKEGNSTSEVAKQAMELLYNNQIPFQLKATLMAKDFKYMSDAWDDILSLRNKYGNLINYAPTIDYHTVVFSRQYYNDLRESLLSIAKKELQRTDNYKEFLFSWFGGRQGKVSCGSGKYMSAIDINGNVHFCHGCIYGNHFNFTNIYTKNDLLDLVKENNQKLKDNTYDKVCANCVATTCIRCNYLKYLNSRKSNFLDKFYDFKSQPDLCKYYQLSGKIDRAISMLLEGKR